MSEIYPLGEDVKVHESELTMLHDRITERSMAAGWKAPQCYPFYSNLYDHAKHYLQRAEKAEAKINKYHHEMMKAQMFIRDGGHAPAYIEYCKRYNPSASAQASPTDDTVKPE